MCITYGKSGQIPQRTEDIAAAGLRRVATPNHRPNDPKRSSSQTPPGPVWISDLREQSCCLEGADTRGPQAPRKAAQPYKDSRTKTAVQRHPYKDTRTKTP
eukprot:8820866-Pyramimonas_sp.AAC.1